MSQLPDGIAGSAMACILFWSDNYNIRNTNLLALKISLNMNIDVNNYSAKPEGCRARSRVYKAGIMYL